MPFHVFLSHSSTDKPAVEELARRLAREGIQAWLDKWHLIPGDPWQPAIEKALAESETCAVFVGLGGFGSWQNEEMRAAIDQRVRDSGRRFRVIPVLLPGAERAERSSLPTFLSATTGLNFVTLSMTKMPSTGWCTESAAWSLEPARARPFTKVSVPIGVCEFSTWTILVFSSGAKPSYNGS